jgi:hypothetical protein
MLLKGTSQNFILAAYTNINDKGKFSLSRYAGNTRTQDADRNFRTESKQQAVNVKVYVKQH